MGQGNTLVTALSQALPAAAMKPKRCDCSMCEGDRKASRSMLVLLGLVALTGLVAALHEVLR